MEIISTSVKNSPDMGTCPAHTKFRQAAPLLFLAAFLSIDRAVHSQSPQKTWDYSLTVDGFIVPDDVSYVNPTFTADHDWLHLEARYNYEGIRTGSV